MVHLIKLITILTSIGLLVSVSKWYSISFSIFSLEFSLTYLIFSMVLFLIILNLGLDKTKLKEFLEFFFWLFFIIIIFVIYLSYIHCFIISKADSIDYILNYKDFKIEIKYTLEYKIYFILEYSKMIYPVMVRDLISIAPIYFNQETFLQNIMLLDFNNIIPESSSLLQLKESCHSFIVEYTKHKLWQLREIKRLESEGLFLNSLFYQIWLFMVNSLFLISVPHLIFYLIPHFLFHFHIPSAIIQLFFMEYVNTKANLIVGSVLFNKIDDLNMTNQEFQDLCIYIVERLIKEYGVSAIYYF